MLTVKFSLSILPTNHVSYANLNISFIILKKHERCYSINVEFSIFISLTFIHIINKSYLDIETITQQLFGTKAYMPNSVFLLLPV